MSDEYTDSFVEWAQERLDQAKRDTSAHDTLTRHVLYVLRVCPWPMTKTEINGVITIIDLVVHRDPSLSFERALVGLIRNVRSGAMRDLRRSNRKLVQKALGATLERWRFAQPPEKRTA
jgi:hypothetical protein